MHCFNVEVQVEYTICTGKHQYKPQIMTHDVKWVTVSSLFSDNHWESI